MYHELVQYEGVAPVREKVLRGGNLDDLYAERDALNARSSNLTRLRYGVRPVFGKSRD